MTIYQPKEPTQEEMFKFLIKTELPKLSPATPASVSPNDSDFDKLLAEHIEKLSDITPGEDGYISTFYNTDGFHNYLKFSYDSGYLVVSNTMSKKSNRTARAVRISISYLGQLVSTARNFYAKFSAEISNAPKSLYMPVVQNPVGDACLIDMTQVSFKAESDKANFSNLFQIRIEKITAASISGQQKIQLYQWIKLENILDIVHILAVMHKIGQKVKGL